LLKKIRNIGIILHDSISVTFDNKNLRYIHVRTHIYTEYIYILKLQISLTSWVWWFISIIPAIRDYSLRPALAEM
jgi:hypothetical protein